MPPCVQLLLPSCVVCQPLCVRRHHSCKPLLQPTAALLSTAAAAMHGVQFPQLLACCTLPLLCTGNRGGRYLRCHLWRSLPLALLCEELMEGQQAGSLCRNAAHLVVQKPYGS